MDDLGKRYDLSRGKRKITPKKRRYNDFNDFPSYSEEEFQDDSFNREERSSGRSSKKPRSRPNEKYREYVKDGFTIRETILPTTDEVLKKTVKKDTLWLFVKPKYKLTSDGRRILHWRWFVKYEGEVQKIPTKVSTFLDRILADQNINRIVNIFLGKWQPGTRNTYIAFMRQLFAMKNVKVGAYNSKNKKISW